MIPGRARRGGAFVAKSPQLRDKPAVFVDNDGVIPLSGSDSNDRPAGASHDVDGVIHFLSSDAGIHLLARAGGLELVGSSGWEEKADEHLPRAPGLPESRWFLSYAHDGAPPLSVNRPALDVGELDARATGGR